MITAATTINHVLAAFPLDPPRFMTPEPRSKPRRPQDESTDSLHPVQTGADLSALAPVWAKALRREGLTSPVHVALWLDEHRDPAPQKSVNMVLRRMRGDARVVDLSAELGVAHSQVQGLLHGTALRLIV
ncbi:MAG: hypothetical protein L0H31_10150, partial [Nocardioidaceae bacterium]|nr:hypothetical protein [Nocardioidaceae bacterium]